MIFIFPLMHFYRKITRTEKKRTRYLLAGYVTDRSWRRAGGLSSQERAVGMMCRLLACPCFRCKKRSNQVVEFVRWKCTCTVSAYVRIFRFFCWFFPEKQCRTIPFSTVRYYRTYLPMREYTSHIGGGADRDGGARARGETPHHKEWQNDERCDWNDEESVHLWYLLIKTNSSVKFSTSETKNVIVWIKVQ